MNTETQQLNDNIVKLTALIEQLLPLLQDATEKFTIKSEPFVLPDDYVEKNLKKILRREEANQQLVRKFRANQTDFAG